MKIAICHDYFNKQGGGEKVVMTMAKALGADIIAGFVDWKNTYPELKDYNVTILCKSINQWRIANAFENHDFSKYDLIICSGTWCISASKNHPSVWYCHTPARWLYNFLSPASAIDATAGSLLKKTALKSAIRVFSLYWKRKDQKYAKQFDKILCNSENVMHRIKKCYGDIAYGKTSVVYPPIFTSKFRWLGQKDFYLSTARLDSLKRVGIIVEAFKKMPNKKLVVVSGGPELEKIRISAKDFENIRVLGWVSGSELIKLMGTCIATIYIPLDEDFGMSPVESMAAGKPCIGINEGGLKETIFHGKTGYLCKSASEAELIRAVNSLDSKKALAMKRDCISRASKFSDKEFVRKIKSSIGEFEK